MGAIGIWCSIESLKAPSLNSSNKTERSSGTPPSGNIQTLKPSFKRISALRKASTRLFVFPRHQNTGSFIDISK